ncbi:MAG: carbamate kinase [Acidimicrobiales bacterium]
MVLAIGGNSLISDPAHHRVEDQYACLLETCAHVVALMDAGHRLVLTHGNGPQVGFILRRSELAKHELHEVPLPSCVADTQGAIGYQIQQAMQGVRHHHVPVVTVVTQVVVDRDDPGFGRPTKPIGSFMDEAIAKARERDDQWIVARDELGRYRRVVPSPRPRRIVELDAISALVEAGFLVVAAGGGGIPVVEEADGSLAGVEAVIDKDFASALLATALGADRLVISTGVERVVLDFGTDHEHPLDWLAPEQARSYAAAGQFGTGSMLPKVEAGIQFVEATGGEAVITDPAHLVAAVEGLAGTRITNHEQRKEPQAS